MHPWMAIAHGMDVDPVLAAGVPGRAAWPCPAARDMLIAHGGPVPSELGRSVGLNPDGGALIAGAKQRLIRPRRLDLAEDEEPATGERGQQAALAVGNGGERDG